MPEDQPTEEPYDADTADAAAGYRTILDEETADELPADDPNRAVCTDSDHEAFAGDPVEDDDVIAVNAAVAHLGGGG